MPDMTAPRRKKKTTKKRGTPKVNTGGPKTRTRSKSELKDNWLVIRFNKEVHEIDIDDLLQLPPGGEETEFRKVSRDMAYYGAMRARAQSYLTMQERSAEVWRRRAIDTAASKSPAGPRGGGPQEWRVKAKIDGSENMLKWAARIADAITALETLNAVYDALWRKGSLLNAMINARRANLENIGSSEWNVD